MKTNLYTPANMTSKKLKYNAITIVITTHLFYKHCYMSVHKAKDYMILFRVECVWFLEEEYELRFSYLIGWQKAQNSLANCLTHWKQKCSHLILELKGLCMLERGTQLPTIRACSNGANPNLVYSTLKKLVLKYATKTVLNYIRLNNEILSVKENIETFLNKLMPVLKNRRESAITDIRWLLPK